MTNPMVQLLRDWIKACPNPPEWHWTFDLHVRTVNLLGNIPPENEPLPGQLDVSAICHALTDNCVMVTDPERALCTPENCAAMKAALKSPVACGRCGGVLGHEVWCNGLSQKSGGGQ